MKHILVCGDRNWSDREALFRQLDELVTCRSVNLIAGGARGADRLAEAWARARGVKCLVIKANWRSYGKAAGPLRNAEMLERGPDLVVAFHDDLEKSKGTKDMVARARRAGVPVMLVSHTVTGTSRTIIQSTIHQGDQMGERHRETEKTTEKTSESEQDTPDARQIAEEQADQAAEAQEAAGGTQEGTTQDEGDDYTGDEEEE